MKYIFYVDSISSILTEDTKRSFEGAIGYLKLIPGKKYGPFYRVDTRNIAVNFKGVSGKRIKVNSPHLIQPRIRRLKKIIDDCLQNDPSAKLLAETYLDTHREEIEMDPTFALLSAFQLFFCANQKDKIRVAWYEKSPCRWCGLEKPEDFLDAHKKYNIGHLFPDLLNSKTELFLFEFYFLLKDKNKKAGLFFGKTYGGSAIQYKFNNDAVGCIMDLRCINDFSIIVLKANKA